MLARGSPAPDDDGDAVAGDDVRRALADVHGDEAAAGDPDEEMEASEIDRLSAALSEAEDQMDDLRGGLAAARLEADELRGSLAKTNDRFQKWRAYAKRLEAADAARKERARLRAERRKAAPVRYCYYWCSNPNCGFVIRYIFHKGDPCFADPTKLADRCEDCEGVLIWVASAESSDEVEEIAREARAYISVILEAPDDIDVALDAIMGTESWRTDGPAQMSLSELANRFYNAHDTDTGNEFLIRSTTRELRRLLLRLILSGVLIENEGQEPRKADPAVLAPPAT